MGASRPEAPSVAAIIGVIATGVLLALTAFLVYIDGSVIVVIFTTQIGTLFPVAVLYVAGVALMPWWLGRNMRAHGTSWLRTIALCAAVILGLSLLFMSFSLSAMAM